MSFLRRILEAPSYGYERNGMLHVPSKRAIWAEFLANLNVFRNRKNWLTLWCWATTLGLLAPLSIFFRSYFSWPLLVAGFVYSMIVLGTHGTIWLHRYSTHRAYTFKHPVFRFLCRNLVIKLIPEETYVVSHHVHHRFSDQPGDPYNPQAGWLYCFLADANHQRIAKDLDERDYARLCKLVDHTGVRLNSYRQYQTWGTLCHPVWTLVHFTANWLFWYAVFYAVGGNALAIAMFGAAGVWALGVRTFNYEGHGKGKDRRRVGVDFHRGDLSVNQVWPGFVAGEWHNNHHLYPSSARCGFLWYQLDLAWEFIRICARTGMIDWYRDDSRAFFERHYLPYRTARGTPLVSEATSSEIAGSRTA